MGLNLSKCDTHIFEGNTDEQPEVLIWLWSLYIDIRISSLKTVHLLISSLRLEATAQTTNTKITPVERLVSNLDVLQSHHALVVFLKSASDCRNSYKHYVLAWCENLKML